MGSGGCGPGSVTPAPRGMGTCRRAPSPATDRRRPSLVPAWVRDSAPLLSGLGGPGTPVSALSRLCLASNRCRTRRSPPTGQGRPRALPALAPKSWPGPLVLEPLPPILFPPGSLHPTSSARLILTSCFPCPGKEIARWVFPSLPAYIKKKKKKLKTLQTSRVKGETFCVPC